VFVRAMRGVSRKGGAPSLGGATSIGGGGGGHQRKGVGRKESVRIAKQRAGKGGQGEKRGGERENSGG